LEKSSLVVSSEAEVRANRQTAQFDLFQEFVVVVLLEAEVTIVEPDIARAEGMADMPNVRVPR